MKLKSLELQGFKSFPDKTTLNFDEGITAIIGPNGSGKSNISDAVRWVLGETSIKSIRGAKMEDVIFGGTEMRRPMGYAEVSLTLDNTDRENRLNIDFDEVTITRRYYRDGDSEYSLNRKPVRLRDIQELFMNTGLGKGGYSIIGQGKISEIVSRKSEDRRSVFEEAAGIAKYRQRKKEAERRLADTQTNLIRIGDIVLELESRVGPLAEESETAKKYLEVYEEKKKLDIQAAIFDIENVKNRFAELNDKYLIAKRDYESAEDECNSIIAERSRINDDTEKKRALLTEVDNEIAERREKRLRSEGTTRLLENEITHIKDDIAANEERKKSLAEQLSSLNLSKADFEKSVAGLASSLAEMKDAHSSALASFESFRPEIEKITDEIDECEIKLAALSESLIDERLSLSGMVAGDDAGDEIAEKTKEEAQAAKDELDKASADKETSDKKLANLGTQLEELKTDLEKITDEINEKNSSLSDKKEKSDSIRISLAEKEQKRDTLRRLEEHFEGYANAVRYIMQSPPRGVIAPISQIISVKKEYTTAIETALGQNIQNIVTEDEDSAKDCIRALRKAGAGRATFYPLSIISPQRLKNEDDIRKEKGFIGIAHELCSYDAKYSPAIEFALARTAVFSDIDSASDAARHLSFSFRAITLDGQIINAGGSFTGGSAKRESGILSRSEQIKNLEGEIAAAKKDYSALEKEVSSLAEEVNGATEKMSEISERYSLISTLVNTEKVKNDMLLRSLEGAKEAYDAGISSLEGLDKRKEDRLNAIEELRKKIENLSEEEENEKEHLSSLREQLKTKTEEQNSFRTKSADIEMKIIASEHEHTSAKEKLASLIETITSSSEQLSLCDEKIASLTEKLDNANRKITEEAALSGNYEEEEKALLEKRKNYDEDVRTAASRLSETDERYNESLSKRDSLFKTFTKLESQKEEFENEGDTVSERLYEDYEITYADALALGYDKLDEEERRKSNRKIAQLRNAIRSFGPVNVKAIEEYAAVKERYDFLSSQLVDLEKAKKELLSIISKLEEEMSAQFISAFDDINVNFKEVFRELFGGGKAELRLEDPERPLECGIEILAAPPGKVIKSLMSLSGGEQTFVAIALIFAILRVNPTPFCLFDEIEAALDEVNVTRFADYAKRYSEQTQFLIITHRRGTMEGSDMLYGVTMHEKGISEVLGVNIDDAERKLGVKLK